MKKRLSLLYNLFQVTFHGYINIRLCVLLLLLSQWHCTSSFIFCISHWHWLDYSAEGSIVNGTGTVDSKDGTDSIKDLNGNFCWLYWVVRVHISPLKMKPASLQNKMTYYSDWSHYDRHKFGLCIAFWESEDDLRLVIGELYDGHYGLCSAFWKVKTVCVENFHFEGNPRYFLWKS